jgi:hypothetical protein
MVPFGGIVAVRTALFTSVLSSTVEQLRSSLGVGGGGGGGGGSAYSGQTMSQRVTKGSPVRVACCPAAISAGASLYRTLMYCRITASISAPYFLRKRPFSRRFFPMSWQMFGV